MTVWKVCHVDMERFCSWICRGMATGRGARASHWPLAVIEIEEEIKHETNTKCTKPAWEVAVRISKYEDIVQYCVWGIISNWWHSYRESSANGMMHRAQVHRKDTRFLNMAMDYYLMLWSSVLWAVTSGNWPMTQGSIPFLSRCVAIFLGNTLICWRKNKQQLRQVLQRAIEQRN